MTLRRALRARTRARAWRPPAMAPKFASSPRTLPFTMSKKQQKEIERQLIEIINSHANENKCGECLAAFPTWALANLGVLLCGRCAAVHRRVLARQSRVKLLTLDQWSAAEIDKLRRVGNKRARKEWNPQRAPFPYADDDDQGPIEEYLRAKYVEGRFRDTPIDAARLRLRLASVNAAPARLSHRRLTQYEQSQYPSQARQIARMGYSDADAVLEALLMTLGDVALALDVLDDDKRVNPRAEELPPSLPQRPRGNTAVSQASLASHTGSFLANNPLAALAQPATADWWLGQPAGGPVAAQPQMYQYTDPVTGQVLYIDLNGQQYLDPSNPQHLQQLQQQQQPLAAQQTTAQSILGLYNRPDAQPQLQPQPQQQQQQQPTGFGFQQPQPTGYQAPQYQPTGFAVGYQAPGFAPGFAQAPTGFGAQGQYQNGQYGQNR